MELRLNEEMIAALRETSELPAVTLHRGVRVHGTTSRNGERLGNVKVLIRNLVTMTTHEVVSDAKGSFELPARVAPGRYDVMAGASSQGNPMLLLVQMSKTKREIKIPPDKSDYELQCELPKQSPR